MKLSFKPRLAGNAAGTGSTAPAAARTPFDLAFLNPCSRPTAFSLLGEDPAPPATGEPAPRRAIPASFQQAAASAQLLGGAGRKVLETRCAPPARAVAGNVSRSSAPSVANASSAADESQFKAWRLQTARAEGIDAARVCSNAVMHAILQAMPQSLQSLQGVRGIGSDKARKYGDAILALCHGKTPVVSSVAAGGEVTRCSPPSRAVAASPSSAAASTPYTQTDGYDSDEPLGGPGRKVAASPSSARAPPPVPSAADASYAVAQEAFVAWRLQAARAEGIGGSSVCSNTIIHAILQAMPQTATALGAVCGVGPDKVRKYGGAILALCRGQTPMVSSVAAGELTTPVRKTVGDGSQMESQFKAWRKQTADVESVPAFCVCSNAVMNGILACMPQTLQALQGVHGMGPTKVQKYGDAILALCRGQTPMVSSVAAGEMSPNPLWVRTRVGVRVESDPAFCA
jgi:superfamily II DNA helicase RecQ